MNYLKINNYEILSGTRVTIIVGFEFYDQRIYVIKKTPEIYA
jgi:hypothetical protein